MKTTDSVMREKLYIELVGAVARGWTTKENEKKVMDTELAKAITEQVYDLYSHSLAEAKKEWVEEMKGKVNDMKYRGIAHSDLEARRHNALLERVEDLLTGDNPEEAQ